MTEPKPSTRATIWPAPYLLEIYDKALAEGCCRVAVSSEAQGRSLIASFYRIRRKADSLHRDYIKPEYSLVAAVQELDLGSVLFVFNTLPDGAALPSIDSVDSTQSKPAAIPTPNAEPLGLSAGSDEELDIGALIEDLERQADGKGGGNNL